MDKSCKVVDFLNNKGYPDGYPCHGIDGFDISNLSKRDIGVQINLIITYKNKHVDFSSLFLSLRLTPPRRYGEGEWGLVPANRDLESKDISYTVEVKYALTRLNFVYHIRSNSQLSCTNSVRDTMNAGRL
jgi:hypothetical protein